MDPMKKEKILNYSIIASFVVLLILITLVFSNDKTGSIMGNSVYDNKKEYEVGNVVQYANNTWYVVSDNYKSYTLLREKPLSAQEINTLNLGINVGTNGEIPFDYDFDCNENNYTGCSVSLDDSTIGKVLAAYQKSYLNIDELITVDDYTIRLINSDDINRLRNYDWLYIEQYYWTMSKPNYSNLNVFGLYPSGDKYVHMVYDGFNGIPGGLVRPVINVKKEMLK